MDYTTPRPWHYVSGAVYGKPEDADNPAACAIATRASTAPGLAPHFEPTTKDANMRLIAEWSRLDALLDDDETAERIGRNVAGLLSLPKIRSKSYDNGWFRTIEGSKSAAGLARTLARYLADRQG